MDYDKIKKSANMGMAAQSRFFEIYVQPLFKSKPKKNLPFWFNRAYIAWRVSITEQDLKIAQFVEYLCEELAKTSEAELIKVFTPILEAEHDTGIRTEQAEENLWHSKVSKDIERIFSDQVSLYKVLFENEFRLWATVPYFFVCKNYGIRNEVRDLEKVFNIGASEKFQALKGITVVLPHGTFADLIVGFDNQIRNTGAGHDRWEITDKESLLLPITDSKTGEQTRKIELSQQQLEDYLRQCRKTLWILKTGCLIFLENNPQFEAKLQSQKIYKAREIQAVLEEFAANRLFEITKFNLSEDRTRLDLGIKYTPQIVGRQEQIFFGDGEKYDVVNKTTKTSYHFRMLDIIKCALLYLDKSKLPIVSVEMFDEKGQNLGMVEYEPTELAKLLEEAGEQNIPNPSKGQVPDKECQIIAQIRVPYGTRDLFEKMIQEGRL